MRRLVIAGVLVSSLLLVAYAIPPSPLVPVVATRTPSPGESTRSSVVLGAFHVHSRLSDGSGDVDGIAAAAARAGLSFLILTDHGTGTRAPARPAYRHGVLCLEGVEISTNGGHYVSIGMDRAPFPLQGEAADVVEDVARFGGFGIIAHPDSSKASLAWDAWDTPFDGLEWFNLDSQWRDEGIPALVQGLMGFWARPAPALATLLDKPQALLERWDRIGRQRRVVGLAAVDAHARLALGGATDPLPPGAASVRFPSYESSFRTAAMGVQLDRPFSGHDDTDAQDLLRALRSGRAFGVMTGLARVEGVEFSGRQLDRLVRMGDEVELSSGNLRMRAHVDVPAGSEMLLLRDGGLVERGRSLLQYEAREPGVYRLEVYLPRAPGLPKMPWIVTNPIYVRERRTASVAASAPEPDLVTELRKLGPPRIEQDDASTIEVLTDSSGGFDMTYTLASEGRVPPWVAAAWTLPDDAGEFDGVTVTMDADGPLRVSWQLRSPASGDERWRKSVFVSSVRQTRNLAFTVFKPVRRDLPQSAPLVTGSALLLVVDSVNAEPGTSGRLRFSIDGVFRRSLDGRAP